MDTERVAKRGCSRLGVHRFLSMSFWPFIVVGLLMFPHTLCPGLYLFITALSSFCRNCLVSCPVRSLLFSKWLLWEKGTAEKKWKKVTKSRGIIPRFGRKRLSNRSRTAAANPLAWVGESVVCFCSVIAWYCNGSSPSYDFDFPISFHLFVFSNTCERTSLWYHEFNLYYFAPHVVHSLVCSGDPLS